MLIFQRPLGHDRRMNVRDLAIVRGLIAVAWADGRVSSEEHEVVDALLEAYGATPSEAAELRSFAASPRSLTDIELSELGLDDRRVLLQHAVLLTFVDGEQHERERRLLEDLVAELHLAPLDAQRVIEAAEQRAKAMLPMLN
jgi:tellurite resistance protein